MNPARSLQTLFRPFLLPLLLAVAAGVPAETLTTGGTGSALEGLRQLGSAFAKKEPGFVLSVLPSLGTGGAIKGLGAKSLDLGASSRPLKDSEKAMGLSAIACAQTPVVLVTNRRSEQAISTQQLEDVYSGRQARWSDGSALRLVLRPVSETDNQLLMAISTNLKSAVEAAATREGLATAVTDQEAANLLERLPGSLGTSTLALILSESRPLQVLSLNGVAPWVKGAVNPAYPLVKPLYLVLRDDAKPATRRFVAFIQSPEGRSILEKIGYSHALR